MSEGFNGIDGKSKSYPSYVFRVKIDSSSMPSRNSGDFKILEVDHDSESYYLGMRPSMEYDSGTGNYYIHCLYL